VRRRRGRGDVPAELLAFVPEDWPASAEDIAMAGQSQTSALYAWIRWIHARAHYEERHGIRGLPDSTTPENRDRIHIFRTRRVPEKHRVVHQGYVVS
jgi:hypothetical protein